MKAHEFVSLYQNYRWAANYEDAPEIIVKEWDDLTAKQQWKVNYDITESRRYEKVEDGRYVLIQKNESTEVEQVEEVQDDDVEISEEMISNFREFKNVAYFNITVDGTSYPVVAEYHHQTIETEAPIKEALRKWYFMIE